MVDAGLLESMQPLLEPGLDGDEYFYDKWDLLRVIARTHTDRVSQDFPPDVLKTLMSYAKDLGNNMFRRKLFPYAHELYLLGTIIAHDLRVRSIMNVDVEFVSVLYANLAFSKIKLDRFSEAIEAAETSIAMNCDNVKAYYRLVVSLKAMHRYEKAMEAARNGERKAREKGLVSDVRSFSDLARELEVHMPSPPVSMPLHTHAASRTITITTHHTHSPVHNHGQSHGHNQGQSHGHNQGQSHGHNQGHSHGQPHGQSKASVVVSAAAATNSEEVDSSWLTGTNIHTTKKQQEIRAQVTSKAKNKKKKGKQRGQPSQPAKPQPRTTHPLPSSSESEEEEEEEEEEESTEESESEEEVEEPEVNYRYTLPANALNNRFSTIRDLQDARNDAAFGMGLDDFDYGAQKQKAVKPQPQAPPLPIQLELKYETRVACSSCYVKDGEGMLGSRYRERGAHSCAKDILLTRSKQDTSALWLKIRPRPQKMSTQATFGGKFKLCQQYQLCVPCKIGETSCTFAHSETEIEFWSADRSGHMNLPEYISQLRKVPQIPDVGKTNGSPSPVAAAANAQPSSVPPQQAMNGIKPLPRQNPMAAPPSSQPRVTLLPTPGTVTQPRPLIPPPELMMQSRPSTLLPNPNVGPYGRPPMPHQGYPHHPPPHHPPPHHPNAPYGMPPHHPSLQGGISYIDVSSQPYQPPYQAYPTPQPPQQQLHPYQQNYGPIPPRAMPPQRRDYDPGRGEPEPEEEKVQFPLTESHDFGLVCMQCLFETYLAGCYMINLQLEHRCDESLLVVKCKGTKTWTLIRERLNHRSFPGRYLLCRYYMAEPPMACIKAMDHCSFAHSLEEQYLWGMEKDGHFSIRGFILANSKRTKSDMARVEELFRKHIGQFTFLCGMCFEGRPCRIVFRHANHDRCGAGSHDWSQARLLVHVNLQGKITPILPRPFVHKTAFFGMCSAMQYCSRRVKSRCHFAHSAVERDVWYVEKDAQLTRDEVVQASEQFQAKVVQEKMLTSQVNGGNGNGAGATGAVAGGPPVAAQNLAPAVVHCPYHVIHVCEVCWKKGQKRTQKGERCNGPGNGHLWNLNKICMLVSKNKQIRPLPNKIPANCNFIVCKHIQAKRNCDYSGGFCQFAHSTQEVEVWTWMVKNNVKTLDGLIRVSAMTHEPAPEATKKIQQGQSVVMAAKAAPVPTPTGLNLHSNSQYCRYCGVMCDSRRVWDEHCASEQHMFNVNSDKEHQWNFRQPPWGIVGSAYQLCEYHKHKLCQYSHQPDMYNQCQFAHSQEELDEWLERWRWRQMKREVAKQEGVYSYMDELLEEYEAAESGVNVISERVTGVDISCDRQLSAYHQEKTADITWTFVVKVTKGMSLDKVALLYDQDRLHFSLEGYDLHPHTQIAQGAAFLSSDKKTYNVKVQFSGGMFGSFMQWIVLDFGKKPVLCQKLNVELGTTDDQEKVKRLRRELNFARWTGDNRQLVRFDSRQLQVKNELDEKLLRHYKAPSSADGVITQQSLVVELNQHNYMHKMHKLLYMEELTRQQIIASYNLETTVELMEQIDEGTMIFVLPGELFARVPLNDQLSEDTNAGKLILTSVARVLVAPQGRSDQVVFEAVIVEKENFDYDGRGKDYIYMCLSPSCCKALNLRKGQSLAMEIQFQMSRLPFCRMHKAVDLLRDTKIVFPDLSLVKSSQRQTLNISSHVLNEDQVAIIRHVVAESDGYTPPLIIYGSFGTGKSETLAQSVMLLLKQRPNARVLLCTHSNSAADLYISKHLDTFAMHNPDLKMLRIYQEARRLNTVPPIIQKYCLVSNDRSHFELPKPGHIRNHHVVITTLSMALYLASCEELVGHFQHIFIDEAAQALECEAIMPLSLATESTCVVLAGDHMQMSPKVYSSGAHSQGLDQSLLERLFRHYATINSKYRLPSYNILLRKNYRTRMEILRFIAATFYGGPERLECRSNQTETSVPALRFFAAHGCEVQDSDKTSYYNMAEIEETVARIADLYTNWPSEWGRPDASKIGVVTPYYDQVQRLRVSLRRKRKELGQVTVERVMNVQGKEFRALFITTVRTRHLLENPPSFISEGSECDGEFGDLGFLSDEKLLNTAMTRAQSMVAIVGDPVALCIIGKSMNIWRTYLKHCQKMKTIYPTSVTLETVQAQVRSLMNSPLGANLQKLAELSKQEYMGKVSPQRPPPKNAGQSEQNGTAAATASTSAFRKVNENQWAKNSDQRPTHEEEYEEEDDNNPFDVTAKGGFFEDWSMDYRIEPDEIIMQIAKEAMTPTQKSAWASPPQQQGTQEPQSPIDLSTPLKMEDVQVKRHHGHAVVHYKPNWEYEARQRKLLSANDFERQFDSDSDASDSEEGNTGGDRTVYPDYSQQQLKGLLQSEPQRYKKCMLKIESSMNMYALDLDPRSQTKKMRISSRLRCGRGFDKDEVVVEMIQSEEDDLSAQPATEQDEVQGRVVGILARAINPKYRMFVCTVEEGNTGLMVPLNRGIPKIFNLMTPHCHNKAKKGHVCVYTFSKNKEIAFHHWEPVDQTDPGSKLFIVRYLKWDVQCYSPLGIVVGVLPAGTTVEDGMKILNLEHYIPKKFRDECEEECDRIYHPEYRLPEHVLHNRVDHRSTLTFTIDPPESQDLDDAVSIEPLPGDCYNVGIHIADVSYFVKAGSYIDGEALARGVTHYPVGQEPIPMIPNRLSTDLCSLRQGEDRLAISVFLTVTHEGEVQQIVPQRAVIRSRYRLTYDEVETILTEGNDEYSEDLQESLMMLQRLGEIWRKKRLGNGALYQQLDLEAAKSPKAHMLVEELMVTANHQVAKMLLEAYPMVTPLRQQLQPNELELALWRSLHQKQALQSVALTRAFLPKGQTCSCDDECQCIEPVQFEPGNDFVNVSLTTWEQLREAVDEGDLDVMQSLIVNPSLHPQLAMSLLQLQRLQERGVYVCSGDTSVDDQWHYSLNLSAYTHFTSPIRRYPDLIVHRLVSNYIDNLPAPYTQHDLRDMMAHCTDLTVKAKQYERATHALQINVVMKSKPLVLYPIVESIDQDSIRLHYPTVKHITPRQGSIGLNKLNLSQGVCPMEDETQVTLSWQQRIYDIKKQLLNPRNRAGRPVLDTNRYIKRVPAHLWYQLITAILQEDQDRMLDIYDDILQAIECLPKDPRCISDLTSEVGDQESVEHFVNFEAVVGACSVLRVQMASSRLRGLISPKIQLLSLTPSLDICLEHRCDPIHAFAEISTIQAAKQNYGSAEAYRDSWMAALRMEAAVKALASDESAVIHNVPIVWRRKGNGAVYAICTLPLSFCAQRQIKFSSSIDPDVLNEEGDSTDKPFDRYDDYICVRYSAVSVETPPDVANNILADEVLSQEQVTWVGHCLVSMVTRDRKNNRLIVHMDLHQSAITVPEELLTQSEALPRRATMEWIAKTLPDRQMEKALCDLPLSRTPELARDIALGRNPAELDKSLLTQLSDLTSEKVPKLAQPNVGQEHAIRYALTHPFSLIQGPPGTGKTVTGVRLAYLFSALNRRYPGLPKKNGARAQVIYCGPSNKSVDVVAGYLKKLGPSCPRLLRVYSERIEQRDFPLPHNPLPPRSRSTAGGTPSATELELRDVALHHVIRQDARPESARIKRWDAYFRDQPQEVTLAEVQEYQNLVASAQIQALKVADVILCTCTASATPRILLGTNAKQLIIDECGMCTEPESLIPIVALRPQQVVLIGDHKQLRPIVINPAAKSLGLERSLFERYSDKAQMLTTQYRMHDAIEEFPSTHFYQGRLESGREEQKKASVLKFWPGSRQKPISFVHVVGLEEALSVSTADGSEQSKSNALEVQHAVKTATMLTRRFHVKARDIVILSQYRAQCAEISKQLHLKGQDETDTSTVIASQGSEWDYVILSTVRSMPKSRIETNPTRGWVLRNLGFITDQNQINVALTRARKGLIIIGNKHLLRVDPMWRKLLHHYERQQKVVDAHEFMK